MSILRGLHFFVVVWVGFARVSLLFCGVLFWAFFLGFFFVSALLSLAPFWGGITNLRVGTW